MWIINRLDRALGAMGLFVIAGLFVPAVAAGASSGAPPATPSAVFQSLGQNVVNATLSDFQIAGENYLAQSANPIAGGGYQSSGSAAYACNGVRQFRVSEAPTGVIFRSGDVVAVGGWVSERRWEA